MASSARGVRTRSGGASRSARWFPRRCRRCTTAMAAGARRACSRRRRWSALAARTVERRALTQRDRTDRRAADLARLACTAVDEEFLLEVARRAVGRNEIAQRRPTARDRMVEDALHFVGEPCIARERHRARRALRMDAGGEQRLGRVNVADADDDLL